MTDELATDRVAAETLKLTHSHRAFHLSRRVGRALRRFAQELGTAFQPLINTVRAVLRPRPPDGGAPHASQRLRGDPEWGRRLLELARQIPAWYEPRVQEQRVADRFKQFLLGLAERSLRERVALTDLRVPATNNRTEQAIGRLKGRVRAMRGVKTVAGLEVALLLSHVRLG